MVVIFIFVSALLTTIGSVDAFDSIWYNTLPKLRSGHQYLTISAAMAWATLTVLIIVLIIAACVGNFTTEKSLTNIDPDDISGEQRGQMKETQALIKGSSSTFTLIIVVMILLLLTNIAYAIIQLIALLDIAGTQEKDTLSGTAQTLALVSCIMSLLSIMFFIVAFIAYIKIYRNGINYAIKIGKLLKNDEQKEDEDALSDDEDEKEIAENQLLI